MLQRLGSMSLSETLRNPLLAIASSNVLAYGPWKNIIVFLIGGLMEEKVVLPEGPWKIALDHCKVYKNGYPTIEDSAINVSKLSVLILFQT